MELPTVAATMSTLRLLQAQRHRIGTGFQAEGWREPLALLDPFLMVDHFRMREAAFAPHPHAGFSAVTYLFDDSATGLVSRDSLGGEHAIAPGGLHWTLAGRGGGCRCSARTLKPEQRPGRPWPLAPRWP